ncbi:MAG: YhcH/YjgK/YiaL family protein [Erysipelotrichaceae bacterium]|nr:YhcH/YjgK/YiaL family protein [Erysipelotrichaceae bacterium]
MITVKNLPDISEDLQKRIKLALDFIENTDLESEDDGTYEINGKHVYAMLQSFDVKEKIDVPFETHKKYLDIQYVIKGVLKLHITDRTGLTPTSGYDPLNDVIFYQESPSYTTLRLYPGELAILFPDDGHRMICDPNKGDITKIRKCVVKVEVEDL